MKGKRFNRLNRLFPKLIRLKVFLKLVLPSQERDEISTFVTQNWICYSVMCYVKAKRIFTNFHPPREHPGKVLGNIIQGRTGYHVNGAYLYYQEIRSITF